MLIRTTHVRFKGELVEIAPLCKKYKISVALLRARMLASSKVAVENLLYPPLDIKKYFTVNGVKYSTEQLAEKYGLTKSTLQGRITRNKGRRSVEELLYPAGDPPNKIAAKTFTVGEVRKTLKEWCAISPRKWQSFNSAIKAKGLEYAVTAPLAPSSKKKPVKVKKKPVPKKNPTKPKSHGPDLKSLVWDENLELERVIAADRAAGLSDEEILNKRRRM